MASAREDPGPGDRPLRVLAVAAAWPTPERPDYGTFIESQMRSIAEADVSVRMHVIHAQLRKRAYLRGALSMLRLNASREKYDLIHAHGGHCGILALLQRRYPVLISYLAYEVVEPEHSDHGNPWRRRIERFVFRYAPCAAAATITKSRQMESKLPAVARRRNHVLPNGVDHRRFRPIPRDTARGILGWPTDELVVLWIGNPDSPRKRIHLARQAVNGARSRFPQTRLRVCSRIPHDDVPLWMNAADVLLVTSAAEGSPNVVKEAMACNLPIVTTRVGDVEDVIANTPHCRIVRDTVPAISEALAEVLAGAPARTDGRLRTRHLEASAIARRLVAIYEQVRNISMPRQSRGHHDPGE